MTPRAHVVSAARGDQPMDLAVRDVDGTGRVAMPGVVDSHVHIESMMVLPDQFARAAAQGILAGTRSPILSLRGSLRPLCRR
jgi:adenine deaminase